MSMAARPGDTSRVDAVPVARLFRRFGLRGTLQAIGLVALVFFAACTIILARPDLQNPAAVGNDPSNYFAAGQRLNAGHLLYAIQPGDRPVDNGPFPNPWPYPLLSPPPAGVLWRALALLPGDVSMYLWWLAGAGASLLLGLWLIVRSRTATLPFVLILIPSLSITAWSGNLNALLIPGGAFVWLAGAKQRLVVAGVLVAGRVAIDPEIESDCRPAIEAGGDQDPHADDRDHPERGAGDDARDHVPLPRHAIGIQRRSVVHAGGVARVRRTARDSTKPPSRSTPLVATGTSVPRQPVSRVVRPMPPG